MANQLPTSGYLLGLDIGNKRIGVALASVIARLPQPIEPLQSSESTIDEIRKIVKDKEISLVVVGLPRNLDGEETEQSRAIRNFAVNLEKSISTPLVFADESLSSKRADEIIKKNTFKNVSQDSLAACFILEEFLSSHDGGVI